MKYKYYLRDTTSPRNLEKVFSATDFTVFPFYQGSQILQVFFVYPCSLRCFRFSFLVGYRYLVSKDFPDLSISSVVKTDPDLEVFGLPGSGSVIICSDPDPSY